MFFSSFGIGRDSTTAAPFHKSRCKLIAKIINSDAKKKKKLFLLFFFVMDCRFIANRRRHAAPRAIGRQRVLREKVAAGAEEEEDATDQFHPRRP